MINQEGKTSWILIAVILGVTVFVGLGITAYMNQTTQSLAVNTDSLSSQTPSNIAAGSKNVGGESYKTVALKDVIQYQVGINDKNTPNYFVTTTGTVSDIKFDDAAGSILLSDNYGYYILVTISHADMSSGVYKNALSQIKKGDIVQVGGIVGFTAPADWFFEKSFTKNRQLPEKIGMVYLNKNIIFFSGSASANDNVSVLMNDIKKTTGINFSDLKPAEFERLTEGPNGIISKMLNGLSFEANQIALDKAQSVETYFVNKGFSTDFVPGSQPNTATVQNYKKDNMICKINDQASTNGQGKVMSSGPGSMKLGVVNGQTISSARDIELQCAELVK